MFEQARMKTHERFFTLVVCICIAASCGLAQTTANNGSLTVGIFPFADVSGHSDIGLLAATLPSLLQSALLNQSKLIPRQVNSGGFMSGTGRSPC